MTSFTEAQPTEALPAKKKVKLQTFCLRGQSDAIEPGSAQVGVEALRVGQARGNDVRVADSSVSRFHFELRREAGALVLRDLNSTNGTRVNGVRVREALLQPGQHIQAGRAEFVIETRAEPTEVDSYAQDHFGRLMGGSQAMRALYARMEKAAQSDVTVLIQGESGTGKELVAEEIHRHSPRCEGPFVIVDCGALPDDLIESELFGHEKGAFTGATGERAGAFEAANGGTLFLDEIGELPLALQPKLLRALEAKTVKRLGANTRRSVDIRVVAATHRDLRKAVNAGAFRADLFWRLSVLELDVCPLRERAEDIPQLIQKLFERCSLAAQAPALDAETLRKLCALPWYGNVRELRNFVERSAVLGATDLPVATNRLDGESADAIEVAYDTPFRLAKERWVEHFEKKYLAEWLSRSQGNMSRLAREASMDRAYLLKLLKKHQMR